MKPKIFIVAGHAGKGTGARGIIDEGEHTLKVREALKAKLLDLHPTCLSYIEVDNEDASLRDVVKEINGRCNAHDICIDIHLNAFNGQAHGTEVLISKSPTAVERELAEQVLQATVTSLGTRNRGVKPENAGQHSRLAMLNLKCNSVLLEVCFCDNRADVARYNDHFDTLIYKLAHAIIRTASRT